MLGFSILLKLMFGWAFHMFGRGHKQGGLRKEVTAGLFVINIDFFYDIFLNMVPLKTIHELTKTHSPALFYSISLSPFPAPVVFLLSVLLKAEPSFSLTDFISSFA